MIKKSRDPRTGGAKVTFALPADHPAGTVSVVGTFNGWTPGAHPLKRRSNGTMSASVVLPAGQSVQFRYLGADGQWFDDPAADAITADGGLLEV